MVISKELEKVLRQEFKMLKLRVKNRDKDDLFFARNQCKTLLKCLKQRWNYDIRQLFEEEAYGDIDTILHDLRND